MDPPVDSQRRVESLIDAITFRFHADPTSFAGSGGRRVVEEGQVELRVARSGSDAHHIISLTLVGGERRPGFSRRLVSRSGVDVAPWSQKEVNVA
jgi:beta-xylosidase